MSPGCWIGAVTRVRADIEKSAAAAGKPAAGARDREHRG